MKVGLAIYELLTNNAKLTPYLAGRIYPERAPEGATTPYVVYSVISNQPYDNKKNTPIDEANVEIFSVANGYSTANLVADLVRNTLDRQGISVSVSVGEVDVQSIRYTNEYSEISDDRKYYAQVQEYTIRITR
jgi:hypothetical protein